ncbi:hypothetical protein TRFO_41070 [Tritrichomonas foetus]|uniref:Uncharacterized protein n=1 Tax=Tritrichomonas foetus TaxID=1144522 RepID=A0A1J4L5T6_9EUKA|nr:hypothetical protein TRFO_41070 [Tritrichomonas foetus]|eukprot:OHT17372.1 hypothetical protein TRFO_41070 [Tritrichomonas foetus]
MPKPEFKNWFKDQEYGKFMAGVRQSLCLPNEAADSERFYRIEPSTESDGETERVVNEIKAKYREPKEEVFSFSDDYDI